MVFRALVGLSSALLCIGPVALGAVTSSSPIICEDSLDGGTSPPFNANDVPCLLGCGLPLAHASGSLLPGSIETSTIPYCQLDCVRTQASPEQSAAAPACYSSVCKVINQGTPENVGWCMYWCVAGFSDVVRSTACVPSLAYGSPQVTVLGGQTETLRFFTHPAAWRSWYSTETVLPHATITTAGAGKSTNSQVTTAATTSRATANPTTATSTASATSTTTVSLTVPDSTAAVGEAISAPASSSLATAKLNTASGSFRVPAWPGLTLGAWVGWIQW